MAAESSRACTARPAPCHCLPRWPVSFAPLDCRLGDLQRQRMADAGGDSAPIAGRREGTVGGVADLLGSESAGEGPERCAEEETRSVATNQPRPQARWRNGRQARWIHSPRSGRTTAKDCGGASSFSHTTLQTSTRAQRKEEEKKRKLTLSVKGLFQRSGAAFCRCCC